MKPCEEHRSDSAFIDRAEFEKCKKQALHSCFTRAW